MFSCIWRCIITKLLQFCTQKNCNDNDDEVQFGPEAAKTLVGNFYVDDLLKSTPDAQSAISLIKAVKKMFKAGGFKLLKLICNNTVVLNSLQEDQRRKSVKDADLSSGGLPVERALGVQCNIDEETFGLKIAAEEKPLIRHGLLSTLSSVYNALGLKSYAKKTVLGMNHYQEG